MYAYDADKIVELDETVRVRIRAVEGIHRSTVLTVAAAMRRIERGRYRLSPRTMGRLPAEGSTPPSP